MRENCRYVAKALSFFTHYYIETFVYEYARSYSGGAHRAEGSGYSFLLEEGGLCLDIKIGLVTDNADIRFTILEYLSSDHRRLLLFEDVERQLSVFLREEAAEIRGSYLALLDFQRDSQIYSSHSSLDSCSSVSDHLMMDVELGDLSDRSG